MGRSATGDEAKLGIRKKQSPVWFHVFWQLCGKCARKVCGHLRWGQRLLLFGTAAGLEESRVDDHLPEAALVDNATAHFLPGDTLSKAWVSVPSCTERLQEHEGKSSTSSSRTGPGRSRWRELSASAWTLCPSRRRTGCYNLETGLETHWKLCCGHRNLLGNQKQTH